VRQRQGNVRVCSFTTLPLFVFALDVEVPVPGLGFVKVDGANGGMIFPLVDASSVGLKIDMMQGERLVELCERINMAVLQHTLPVLPEDPNIRAWYQGSSRHCNCLARSSRSKPLQHG
jgi:proline racemase